MKDMPFTEADLETLKVLQVELDKTRIGGVPFFDIDDKVFIRVNTFDGKPIEEGAIDERKVVKG